MCFARKFSQPAHGLLVTGGFSVTPDDIRAQAGVIRDADTELSDALNRLQSSLAQLGNVPGGDGPGRRFASRYDPNTTAIEQNVGNLARAGASMYDSLVAMASNYTDADSASGAAFRANGAG